MREAEGREIFVVRRAAGRVEDFVGERGEGSVDFRLKVGEG